jgi:L-rhamnose mutarotase
MSEGESTRKKLKRYGGVIGLKDECLEVYKTVHDAVWPDVLAQIRRSNVKLYLFSYFEYVGDDFAGDMAKMSADPATQKWWVMCNPMQTPLEDRAPGEWFAMMEEVFHID